MNRDRTLELLSQHKVHLARRYGVTGLAPFGSTVRGESRDNSDIDIVVGFDGPATSERYFIVAIRNRLIHGYLGIDNDTHWSIVQDDLPALLARLRELRDRSAPSSP